MYAVAQCGARRGYAVPLALDRSGLLAVFVTDSVASQRWSSLGKLFRWVPGFGPRIFALTGRMLPRSLSDKTRSFTCTDLAWRVWLGLRRRSTPEEAFAADIERQISIGRAAARALPEHCSHLFVMETELPSLIAAARDRGMVIVSEVYLTPSAHEIEAHEAAKFPAFQPRPLDRQHVLRQFQFENIHIDWVDHFICPAPAVADDLVAHWGAQRQQISIVPYGMNSSWLELRPNPQPGRVLFVGSAILRKGIHYLAMAAEELHRRGHRYEFRVAGHVEDAVRNQPVCRHLTFLGRIDRSEVHREYQQADVFTLPSLAEGSAEVTYEALAAALPLVTTAASGSVATDGIEGRIIPERDPTALADALESIIEDRPTRNRMAEAARTTARDYTWEKYGDRLVSALLSVPTQ